MDNQELIQALIDNEKPFGLMSKEMQAKAKEIGEEKFEDYDTPEKTTEWFGCDIAFVKHITYHLCPDYTEDEGVERCEVYNMEGHLHFKTTDQVHSLHQAMDEHDFIGYLYEDDILAYPDARKYRDGNGCWYTYWKPGFEVLTPTHVLFRSKP